MKHRTFVAALFPLTIALYSYADENESGFQVSGNAQIWAYGSGLQQIGNSVVNPGNLVANLYDSQWASEIRINLRLQSRDNEIVIRPRLLRQHSNGIVGDADTGEAYFSQAFVRHQLDDNLTLTAGRDLLTWGPANFRSPSNPIYFDAGRTNPLRDVSGVDLLRLTYTQGPYSALLGQVQTLGHLSEAPRHLTIAKLEVHGEDVLASVILAGSIYRAPFFGAFAQATLNEAWMLYGEIGSGQRAQALSVAPSLLGPPFLVNTPSPRKTTSLLGIAYTLENGQSISLEALHDGHGFDDKTEREFFERATSTTIQYLSQSTSPYASRLLQSLGQGLSQAPLLMSQNYLSLLWQSNPQDTEQYWRVMWTLNSQDNSKQVSLYSERNLVPQITLFGSISRNFGSKVTEFGMMTQSTLILGFKYFVY